MTKKKSTERLTWTWFDAKEVIDGSERCMQYFSNRRKYFEDLHNQVMLSLGTTLPSISQELRDDLHKTAKDYAEAAKTMREMAMTCEAIWSTFYYLKDVDELVIRVKPTK